jgi:hypothetical protein
MPKLSILAVCEKVIFDQDGPATIVSIFESMLYRVQDAPLPEKAVLPNQWAVFTQWEHTAQELGQEFAQIIVVTAPDGSELHRGEITFTKKDLTKNISRIRALFRSIPIWKEGMVRVDVFLKGQESAPQGSTGFSVRYIPKEANVDKIATPTASA